MVESTFIEFPCKDGLQTFRVAFKMKNPDMDGTRDSVGRALTAHVTVTKDSKTREIDANEMRNEAFEMINFGTRATLNTWFGLEVHFGARGWRLDIYVPTCYASLTEGLCGNFNGNKDDDFSFAGYQPHEINAFGRSWQTDWIGEIPAKGVPAECTSMARGFMAVLDINTPNDAEENLDLTTCDAFNEQQCKSALSVESALLLDKQLIGKVSQKKVSRFHHQMKSAYADCVYDNCFDDVTTCSMIQAQANDIMRQLSGIVDSDDLICMWAEAINCVPDCGAHAHWDSCANECQAVTTCGNRQQEKCSSKRLRSMCVCDDGFVLLDGECVTQDACGVTDDDGVVHAKPSQESHPLWNNLVNIIMASNDRSLRRNANLDLVFEKFKPNKQPELFKVESTFKIVPGMNGYDRSVSIEVDSSLDSNLAGNFLTVDNNGDVTLEAANPNSKQSFYIETDVWTAGHYIIRECSGHDVMRPTAFVPHFAAFEDKPRFKEMSIFKIEITDAPNAPPKEAVVQVLGPLEVMHTSFNNVVDQAFKHGDQKYAKGLKQPMSKNIARMKKFYSSNECPNVQHFTMRSDERNTSPCDRILNLMDDIMGWVAKNMDNCANKPGQPADRRAKKMIRRLMVFKKKINSSCGAKYARIA